MASVRRDLDLERLVQRQIDQGCRLGLLLTRAETEREAAAMSRAREHVGQIGHRAGHTELIDRKAVERVRLGEDRTAGRERVAIHDR